MLEIVGNSQSILNHYDLLLKKFTISLRNEGRALIHLEKIRAMWQYVSDRGVEKLVTVLDPTIH